MTPTGQVLKEVCSEGKTMNRYLIEFTHTAKDCPHSMEQFIIHGHIINYGRGCKTGLHSSRTIV